MITWLAVVPVYHWNEYGLKSVTLVVPLYTSTLSAPSFGAVSTHLLLSWILTIFVVNGSGFTYALYMLLTIVHSVVEAPVSDMGRLDPLLFSTIYKRNALPG